LVNADPAQVGNPGDDEEAGAYGAQTGDGPATQRQPLVITTERHGTIYATQSGDFNIVVTTFMELASLPILAAAVRNLAKNPDKLGAYLPSVAVGFVNGWCKLDEARARLRKSRAERRADLAREIEADEAEALAQVPDIRRGLDVEILAGLRALADLEIELTSEKDEQRRARLEEELQQATEKLEIQRELRDQLTGNPRRSEAQ
jgi:hypothetical protein